MEDQRKPIYKIKFTMWEAEQTADGKWLLIDPTMDGDFHMTVPHSWFMRIFEPMTGRAQAAMSERMLYGPFSEH